MLLHDEGDDREQGERNGGSAARTCVRSETKERQRREDEHELRRMGEVAVKLVGGIASTRYAIECPSRTLAAASGTTTSQDERSAHAQMMPASDVRLVRSAP